MNSRTFTQEVDQQCRDLIGVVSDESTAPADYRTAV
jgi:hypothetical protein